MNISRCSGGGGSFAADSLSSHSKSPRKIVSCTSTADLGLSGAAIRRRQRHSFFVSIAALMTVSVIFQFVSQVLPPSTE